MFEKLLKRFSKNVPGAGAGNADTEPSGKFSGAKNKNTRKGGNAMVVTPFRDPVNGFTGWQMRLSTGRAIPTPAVRDGRVFVGGGFGSHEFYSIDLQSGELAWQLHTTDDGPTAAVLSDEFVVFNTESCTLEVVESTTGKLVWEKWLGDPLLAQPAVGGGRVCMVYPREGNHYLGSFRLADGAPEWMSRIDHDVISAPVVAEGRVYLSTFDGTVWCVNPLRVTSNGANK